VFSTLIDCRNVTNTHGTYRYVNECIILRLTFESKHISILEVVDQTSFQRTGGITMTLLNKHTACIPETSHWTLMEIVDKFNIYIF